MLGIHLIPKDHIYSNTFELKHIIYFILLSSIKASRGFVNSQISLGEVYDYLRNYEEKQIDTAINELVNDTLIEIKEDIITIGEITNGTRKIYSGGMPDNLDRELTTLKTFITAYEKECRGLKAKVVIKLGYDIETLFSKNVNRWKVFDYGNLFKYSYEAVFQSPHRELMDKEFGQLKNVFKLYDAVVLAKMIVEYITNSDIYSKAIPTIGSFIYYKDSIYAKVQGLKRTNQVLRTIDTDDDFK